MSTLTSTADVAGILPPEYGELVTQPVDRASVAIQASTLVTTEANEFHVPQITDDATAAWVAEGAEIPTSDPTLAELVVTPAKVAGLTVISNELANDSNPAALRIMGRSLARDIAKKVDAAYFGALTSPAPSGLEALTGRTTITLPTGETAWVNLDPFAEALSAAETEGATITSWVAHPDDALALATLKDETGSNRPLLGTDPTTAGSRSMLGVPLLVSPAVTVGTVWGLPREYAMVIRRHDVEVLGSQHAYFSQDMTAIRAVMRVGFAWPHPAAVVAVQLAAA